jgi:Membrane proteins related to metalloendopeptidases
MVFRDAEHWVAVVGIALATPPSQQTLTILHANGAAETRHFMVRDKAYEAQHLSLKNHRMVNPKPQDLKRIGRDERRIRLALAKWSDTAPSELVLQKPVEGPFSSAFGLRRFFNAQPRKPHRGLDIAAPKGTPIKAPLGGRVIESGNFFFNGNTVFLDHGQGLVTLYCHMDRIDVRAGQRLERGEQIGTVGATGRVTGPHLHWGVSLNQTLIDPLLFLPTRSATAWSAPASAR